MAAAMQPPSSSSSSYFSHPRSSRDGFSLGGTASPDYIYSHKRGSSNHSHQPRMPKTNPPTSPPPQPPSYDFQYDQPMHTPSPFKKRDLIARTPIPMLPQSTRQNEWTPTIAVRNGDGTVFRQVDRFKRPDDALTPENSSEEDREVDAQTPIYLRSEVFRESLVEQNGRYTPTSPNGEEEEEEEYDADSILGAYENERKHQRYSTMSDTVVHHSPGRPTEYEQVFEEDDSQNWYNYKGTSIKGRDITPSKIPIYYASPKPIPMEYIFRSAPLHRSPSTHLDQHSLEIQNLKRVRSESLLDTFPKSQTATTPRTSPTKRKHSTLPRPRSRSLTSMRPSIRSVRTITPGTTPKRMEAKGEPPWIQHSFSPDPSLPPDEQLIPTVARRLNQERLEREKGLVTVWDREMRPLDGDRRIRESKVRVHKEADDMPTGSIFVDEAIPEEEKTWPLNEQKRPPPIDPTKYPSPAPVPISPGGPVRVDARALSVTLGPMQRFDAVQDQRHKDDDVKGACCCIIM